MPYKPTCIRSCPNKSSVCLCSAHIYVHSYRTQHHPCLQEKISARLCEEQLVFAIWVFFLFFSYLKVNHHRIVLCWFQPVCEDSVSWKSPLFLPGQSCCILWPTTFYQGNRSFSWLQNGTWKTISSQYFQTKASKDIICDNTDYKKKYKRILKNILRIIFWNYHWKKEVKAQKNNPGLLWQKPVIIFQRKVFQTWAMGIFRM